MSKKKDPITLLRVDKLDLYSSSNGLPSFVDSKQTDGLLYAEKGVMNRSSWRLVTDIHELGPVKEGEKGTITLFEVYKYGFYPEERSVMWEELSGGLVEMRKFDKEYYYDLCDDFKKDLPVDVVEQCYDLADFVLRYVENEKVNSKDFNTQKNKVCRICLAYSLHNKDVNICFALLKITFFLYTTIQAEEMTFWVLDGLIMNIFPQLMFYSNNSFLGFQVEKLAMCTFIAKVHATNKYKNFSSLPCSLLQRVCALLSSRLLFSLCIDSLDETPLLKAWDVIFTEGMVGYMRIMVCMFVTACDEIFEGRKEKDAVDERAICDKILSWMKKSMPKSLFENAFDNFTDFPNNTIYLSVVDDCDKRVFETLKNSPKNFEVSKLQQYTSGVCLSIRQFLEVKKSLFKIYESNLELDDIMLSSSSINTMIDKTYKANKEEVMKLWMDDKLSNKLISAFASKKDTMSASEMLLALALCLDATVEERLKEAFFIIDSDKDNFLSINELISLLSILLRLSFEQGSACLSVSICRFCFDNIILSECVLPCLCAPSTTNGCHVSCLMNHFQGSIGNLDGATCVKCKSIYSFSSKEVSGVFGDGVGLATSIANRIVKFYDYQNKNRVDINDFIAAAVCEPYIVKCFERRIEDPLPSKEKEKEKEKEKVKEKEKEGNKKKEKSPKTKEKEKDKDKEKSKEKEKGKEKEKEKSTDKEGKDKKEDKKIDEKKVDEKEAKKDKVKDKGKDKSRGPHIVRVAGKGEETLLEIDLSMNNDPRECLSQVYSYLERKEGIDENNFITSLNTAASQNPFYIKELLSPDTDLKFTLSLCFIRSNKVCKVEFVPASDMDELVNGIIEKENLDKGIEMGGSISDEGVLPPKVFFKIQIQPGWIARLEYEVDTDPQDTAADFCYYEGLSEESVKKAFDVLIKAVEASRVFYPHIFIENSREDHLRFVRERKKESSKKDCTIQ